MTDKTRTGETLGYGGATVVAALVGVLGGGLFGVWDGVSVIMRNASSATSFGQILTLALYSVSVYASLGCLVMAALGVATFGVLRAGKYSVGKPLLAGIFSGMFVLLAIFLLLGYHTITGNIFDITETTIIGVLSGMGLVGLGIYLWVKFSVKESIIATGISLFVTLPILVYVGLGVNYSLLSGPFYEPVSLLANLGLLLLATFLAIGLYRFSLLVPQRFDRRTTRQAGYALGLLLACTFVTISFVGPFSPEGGQQAEASRTGQSGNLATSEDLKGKPNILWIVIDTLRADHLSCYGYEYDTSPNIDEIAKEGILFENAISAAPWTLPSHSSMFTGMFPSKHGADAEHRWLDDLFKTVAEVLRSHGYMTLGYSNNPQISPETNLSRGFETFAFTTEGKIKPGPALADSLRVSVAKYHLYNLLLKDDGAHQTNDTVTRWIAKAARNEAPFFMFINYMEVHDPYHPPNSYAIPFLGDLDFDMAMKVNQSPYKFLAGTVDMDSEDFDALLALYDGEISYLDFKMGQLFDYLRELDILDNTVLIITADHGENFGEHGLMNHHLCVYDTLIHVPLIIRYPKLFEPGTRVDTQVQLTDIYPTILDIVGIRHEGREQVQGRTLLKNSEERESVFAIAEHAIFISVLDTLRGENPEVDVWRYTRRLRTIRTDEWKFISASDGRDELYDLRRDPGELENLIKVKPEKANELKEQLERWLNSFESYRSTSSKG